MDDFEIIPSFLKGERTLKLKKRDNIERMCKYCEHSVDFVDKDKMICSLKGVVSVDYLCKKFTYDPLKREPSKTLRVPDDIEFPEV